MRIIWFRIIAAVVLLSGQAVAQQTTNNLPASSPAAADTKQWSFSVTTLVYVLPHERSYVAPTFTADRQALHLEARYNYEDQETGSLWVGYNFSFGEKLAVEITPMIGAVFGNTNGVAPGYRGSISYKGIALDTEGEYVFDAKDRSGNFFYNWSELTYSPKESFRVGIVVQRTKAYQTELDVQRGVLAGFSYKKMDFAGYLFNVGWTDPTFVFSFGVSF